MDFNHIDISCIKQYIFIEGIFITSCVICDCKSNLIFCRSCHFYILHLLNNIAPILMYQQFTDKKLEEIMFDMELKFSRGELSIEAFAKLRQYLMSILEKNND
ncbi:hypothetical protein EXVG_00450 [Emiliania huxleyi virus 202]|nr:hypothetical protein EXVG_00450 [Emiliania huxleyi virus 202]